MTHSAAASEQSRPRSGLPSSPTRPDLGGHTTIWRERHHAVGSDLAAVLVTCPSTARAGESSGGWPGLLCFQHHRSGRADEVPSRLPEPRVGGAGLGRRTSSPTTATGLRPPARRPRRLVSQQLQLRRRGSRSPGVHELSAQKTTARGGACLEFRPGTSARSEPGPRRNPGSIRE